MTEVTVIGILHPKTERAAEMPLYLVHHIPGTRLQVHQKLYLDTPYRYKDNYSQASTRSSQVTIWLRYSDITT